MAADTPNPNDPNKIDISLSILSGQSGLAFDKFVQELEGLRKGLEALAKTSPSAAAQATREAARFYMPAPQDWRPAGLSSTASRATTTAPGGGQAPAPAPAQTVQDEQRSRDQAEADRLQAAKNARTALGEGLAAYPRAGARQAFNQYVRAAFRRRPLDIGGAVRYGAHDEEEGDAGAGGGGGSRQGHFLRNADWWQRLDESTINAPLKMPRAGHFTAQDVLNTGAQFLSGQGFKSRERQALGRGALSRDEFADTEQGYADYKANLQSALDTPSGNAKAIASGSAHGDVVGNVGALMYKAANQWAPKVALAKQYYDRYVGIKPSDLLASGYEQGASGQGGDISLGPIGLRTPFALPGTGTGFLGMFNPAAATGFAAEKQDILASLSAGINREQAGTIQQATINSGRAMGDPQHNQFYNALTNLTKWNPTIGQSPTTAEMLDKVLRYGGNTDVKRFVDTIKEIPTAAKAAHVHINQMVQDMAAMGEFNRTQGGNYYTGMEAARLWSLGTGLPAALLPGLEQNGFVQTQNYMESGLPPWQQGLMSGAQRGTAAIDAVMRLGGLMGQYSHPVKGKTDGYGFTSGGATADQMTAANVSMMLGGALPPEAIQMILHHGKHMRAQIQLAQDARGVTNQIKHDQMLMHGLSPDEAARARKMLHDGNLYDERVAREMLKNGVVDPVVAARAKQDYQRLLSGTQKQRSWASLQREMSDAGFSKKDIAAVKGVGQPGFLGAGGLSGAKLAAARQHKIEDIVGKHAANFDKAIGNTNQPSVTIELGKSAAKHFHLSTDAGAQSKLSAGAGFGATNSYYGSYSRSTGP